MAFITIAGEQLIAQKQGASQVLVIQSFVLANVPGLGSEPTNRIETIPDAGTIVDTKPITYSGYVNSNQVVYSLALDSTIGDYDFNWVGLKSAEGVLIACEHIPLTQKRKTVGAVAGNNLTRNFLLSFSGATATTAISVPASTWQIDFTTRLLEIDNRNRLSNLDSYGAAAFFDTGFQVSLSSATVYNIAAGIGYVYGIRCEKTSPMVIDSGSLPKSIWMDVSLQGNINGVAPVINFTATTATLTDSTDGLGFKHYVTKIADISAGGLITDLRQDVIATKSEAQAGISTIVRRWNPLRVKQAAMSALQLPAYALPLPIINTANNKIPVTEAASSGTGGTVSIAAGTRFTLANYVSAGFGTVSEYTTTAFTSATLSINSSYFLRAQIDSTGNLIFYMQKGTLFDADPVDLKGTQNGTSGGGFYSTPFDMCIAQVITGYSGQTPVVRTVINSKNNYWKAFLTGNSTYYLPLDPYVLRADLSAAVLVPYGNATSNIFHGSNGWDYSSYVTMSPMAGTAVGDRNTAVLTNNFSTGAAPILSPNYVGDTAISTVSIEFHHLTGMMMTKTHHCEHQLGMYGAEGGDEQFFGLGQKNLLSADYSAGLAINYTNCSNATVTWRIMR